MRRRRSRAKINTNIEDVAVAAKVSVATVSRTMERPELVREETRLRVHEAIKQLRYTPNVHARGLRTARTRLIIALVPDIANPFFSEVIRGIEQAAHERSYSVLLGNTQNSRSREQAYVDLVAARQADGLITLLPRAPQMKVLGRMPVVNACEYVLDSTTSSVSVDNVAGAESAISHLLNLGHRCIAFVSGPSNTPINVDRRRGYEGALQQAGLKIDTRLIIPGDFTFEAGARAVDTLLDARLKFTAVFCANDEMAIGAIRALRLRGLRVPEDCSIVGFDDIRFARYTEPPLTTVAQPKNQLGREAIGLLLEILTSSDTPVRKHVLPVDLVVRGSAAPCGSAREGQR